MSEGDNYMRNTLENLGYASEKDLQTNLPHLLVAFQKEVNFKGVVSLKNEHSHLMNTLYALYTLSPRYDGWYSNFGDFDRFASIHLTGFDNNQASTLIKVISEFIYEGHQGRMSELEVEYDGGLSDEQIRRKLENCYRHYTTTAALSGLMGLQGILSSRILNSLGYGISSGEYVLGSPWRFQRDKPRGHNQVFAFPPDSKEWFRPPLLWFNQRRVVLGIDRDRHKELVASNGLMNTLFKDQQRFFGQKNVNQGTTIGPIVPFSSVVLAATSQSHLHLLQPFNRRYQTGIASLRQVERVLAGM